MIIFKIIKARHLHWFTRKCFLQRKPFEKTLCATCSKSKMCYVCSTFPNKWFPREKTKTNIVSIGNQWKWDFWFQTQSIENQYKLVSFLALRPIPHEHLVENRESLRLLLLRVVSDRAPFGTSSVRLVYSLGSGQAIWDFGPVVLDWRGRQIWEPLSLRGGWRLIKFGNHYPS